MCHLKVNASGRGLFSVKPSSCMKFIAINNATERSGVDSFGLLTSGHFSNEMIVAVLTHIWHHARTVIIQVIIANSVTKIILF